MNYVKYMFIVWAVIGVMLFGGAVTGISGHHISTNKIERIVSKNGYKFTKYHPDLREYWAYNKDFELTETCSTAKYARMYVLDSHLIQYTCDDITLGYSLNQQEISQLTQNDLVHGEVEITPIKQKENEELFEAEFSDDIEVITEQYKG